MGETQEVGEAVNDAVLEVGGALVEVDVAETLGWGWQGHSQVETIPWDI